MEESVIGLDVGGTKMASAWVTAGGTRGVIIRKLIPHRDNGALLLEAAVETVGKALRTAPGSVGAVGVGVPAIFDELSGLIEWAPNLPGWNSFPLATKLSQACGLPVFLGYDGHMAALGEWWLGGGRQVSHLVVVTLGTGIGGGIISHGKLIKGSIGVAGALGWMVAPGWTGQGGADIGQLERIAGGPGILRRAQGYGTYSSTEEVFKAARAGDQKAASVIQEAMGALGIALANVVTTVGPELILVGGGISEQADFFLDFLRDGVKRHAQPYAAREVRIEKALLGEDAGIIGAARLAFDSLAEDSP